MIDTFESSGTWVAPPSGVVSATAGALSPEPQGLGVVAALRGAGRVISVKSAPLLSVSVQPPRLRAAELVLSSVGAAAPSKKFALP